ncbi:MAG: hypothetical protein JNN30_09155 [Rhodanobacteraceae bacterium]|nr:hypothetical protein [Rhodanobacteraceae bacterium]
MWSRQPRIGRLPARRASRRNARFYALIQCFIEPFPLAAYAPNETEIAFVSAGHLVEGGKVPEALEAFQVHRQGQPMARLAEPAAVVRAHPDGIAVPGAGEAGAGRAEQALSLRVRSPVNGGYFQLIAARLTDAEKRQLDGLLIRDENAKKIPLQTIKQLSRRASLTQALRRGSEPSTWPNYAPQPIACSSADSTSACCRTDAGRHGG